MTTEICVWVGGDRNHLSLWDRLDGHTAAIKAEGWPWTQNETGGNHRVARVNTTIKDLIFLRQHAFRMAETKPNHFEHDSMARIGVLLPEIVTQVLKRLPPGEILHIDRAFLMNGIRIAPEWPTHYMTHTEKAVYYRSMRLQRIEQNKARLQVHSRRVQYWCKTTAICPAEGKIWRNVPLAARRERSINRAVVALKPKRAA